MFTINELKNNEIETLVNELVSRLRERNYDVSRENEKIVVERQEFLLSTERREFLRMRNGSYMLPVEFGTEVLIAFILHILQEKDSNQHKAVRFVNSVGIRPNLHGYHFLISAICLGLERPDDHIFVTEKIYPAIASLYHVNVRCVERSIRNAVNDAYKNNPERLCRPFYYKVSKPYNSELIALAVELIRYKDIF